MERFNYQIVIKVDDNERIIFAGVTELDVYALIQTKLAHLPEFVKYDVIENVVYQPEKPLQDESKERK